MNTATAVRETQINVRLNDEEHERLKRAEAHFGLSGPNVFRMLLKKADDELQRTAPAPVASKTKKPGKR